MKWTQQQIDECIEMCRKKAVMNMEFRKQLLMNPAEAVKTVSGRDIPAGFRIKVIESDPAYDATFVLPPTASGGVSDQDLDDITGGICGSHACSPHACGKYEECPK